MPDPVTDGCWLLHDHGHAQFHAMRFQLSRACIFLPTIRCTLGMLPEKPTRCSRNGAVPGHALPSHGHAPSLLWSPSAAGRAVSHPESTVASRATASLCVRPSVPSPDAEETRVLRRRDTACVAPSPESRGTEKRAQSTAIPLGDQATLIPCRQGKRLGHGCQSCWRRFLLQAHVAQLWLGFRVLATDMRGWRVVAGVGELGCWPVLACWPRRCSPALCGCGWCLCLSYGPRLPHDLREHATDGWSCRS